jgi:hypothetical protein
MVGMLTSWVQSSCQVNPKTIKLVFVASPLAHSIKEKKQRLVGSELVYNVSQWTDMSTHELFFQESNSTYWSGTNNISIISSNVTCSRHGIHIAANLLI